MIPKCSVVVPVYNREDFIEKTLNSVLDQTYKELELIVVDDCSTDRSYEIVKEIANRDPRVVLIKNDVNMGVADTRNIGIQKSSGKYVALLDSDDLWLDNKLEIQINHIEEKGCSLAYCGYGFFDKEGNRIGDTFHVPETVNLNQLLKRNVISCSTVLGERQLFINHKFDKRYYHEDLVAWISMLKECGTAYGVLDELAEITIMKGSKSGNKLKCAKERWKVYRDYLDMRMPLAVYYFLNYAYFSVAKYRPIRKDL
ncbi:glycosyltransferase family 2 protein [Alkalibacter mobilis]|uniref:glycosyltransferase family 2 protein n=1 Tax=Alkalibacter mobilis TaxID=2787712 RepID=UPI0018A07C03|nr:glycosyltransferase family 2 protein [Alkalibacter mobilis]MBF7097332.1 glycosyltransferase family 2 protein [Alkalibacter mobilis]